MDDEMDLSGAELFYDGNRGIYIPQNFAQDVDRSKVTGVDAAQWADLEAGPEGEFYWETWAMVTDSARLKTDDGREWYLWQDGDLWMVPVESGA